MPLTTHVYTATPEQFALIKTAIVEHGGVVTADEIKVDGAEVDYAYASGVLRMTLEHKGVLHMLTPTDHVFATIEKSLGLPHTVMPPHNPFA